MNTPVTKQEIIEALNNFGRKNGYTINGGCMKDKELLGLAAKAHGELVQAEPNGDWIHEDSEGNRGAWWNPLTDDGDALRLAVKLNLTIKIYGANTMVYDMNDKFLADFVDCETDTATRRAIVRAAAGIGRMK